MAEIDFYYWPTPNGWKVSILLEELGLPYNLKMVDIGAGDQFTPEFLAISPNNRMPAIVDHAAPGGPLPVFESGAILWHMAQREGRFIPEDPVGQKEVMEWLFWQTGNLGPMAGQHSHFWNYAPGAAKQGYAAERYRREYDRCLGVLDRRLKGRDYLCGDYSVADMMSWPWVLIAKAMGVPLDDYPDLVRWRAAVKARPAVQRGVALGKDRQSGAERTEEQRKRLFEQSGRNPDGAP